MPSSKRSLAPSSGGHPITLASATIKDAARRSGFPLVGLAPAARLDGGALKSWLDSGHAADMTWMHERTDERLDPGVVLPGARTVIALAIPYHRASDEPGPIARYARGRDYHYAHRDRMKILRKALLRLDPGLQTYACVDTGVAMEKVWAERAGLGFIGKNGCLITSAAGSWVTLSVMFVDRAADRYDTPGTNQCGECVRCLRGCPTRAITRPGVVDARRCISYQTIENHGLVPLRLRPRMAGHVFGCDVCQEVCPFNRRDLPEGDPRQNPRPLGQADAEHIAGLGRADYAELVPGMALARAGFDALRRNAVLALGAARSNRALPLVRRLRDDPSPLVAEAARWAERRILAAPAPGLTRNRSGP